MFEPMAEQVVAITLYTDAFVVRGTLATRQRRLSDILNQTDYDFIVLSDVVIDEFGSHSQATRSEFAQVNLATVIFGVADLNVETLPELRTPKIAEQALISVPPFKITGRIHLLPNRDLREALNELTGRFLPVTEASYWSDVVGEAKQQADMVAVNHARAHIMAPHREVDPWAGLDRGAVAGEAGAAGEGRPVAPAAVEPVKVEPAPAANPWGESGVANPWGDRTTG
jgi:Family of unknown function (DUF6812)